MALQKDADATLTLGSTKFGAFSAASAIEEAAEAVDDYPPGVSYPDKHVGNATLSNVTLTRMWDETRDRSLYNFLKGKTGLGGSGGMFVRDNAKNIIATEPFTCKLVRFKGVEANTNGGTAKAEFEIEVALTGRS